MISQEEREAKIVSKAEEKFLAGHNHYPARTIMSAMALALADEPMRQEMLDRSNTAIIDMLRTHGAQGDVYTIREDFGSGYEDQPDHVFVYERDGKPTGESRRFGEVVIRAATISSQP